MPTSRASTRRAALAAFLLFAAGLLVVSPAEASRTTDARSSLAPSSSLELPPLEPVDPIDPVESSPRFAFAEDLGLLDPEAGPGGFVVFAREPSQCELTYARNNPVTFIDPFGLKTENGVVVAEAEVVAKDPYEDSRRHAALTLKVMAAQSFRTVSQVADRAGYHFTAPMMRAISGAARDDMGDVLTGLGGHLTMAAGFGLGLSYGVNYCLPLVEPLPAIAPMGSIGGVLPVAGVGVFRYSPHALQRALERGVSAKDLALGIAGAEQFQYYHQGVWKTGYYMPALRLFVGEVNGNMTSMFFGTSRSYINNLQSARP